MNTSVVDPHWGGWIIWYFYLGGIAAGAYFLAALADLFGGDADRRAASVGYFLAAPLVAICGILLILDLSRPERFWHMLLDRDRLWPHVKFWSPMSLGAWALLVFGAVSTISFVAAWAETSGREGRYRALVLRLHRGVLGRGIDLLGAACGFFVASYTGVLLTATNQPVWSDSPWLGAMFLASSAGTGLAAIKLASSWLGRRGRLRPTAHDIVVTRGAPPHDSGSLERLERIEPWAWNLELLTAACFLASLGWESVYTLASLGLALPFLAGALGLGVGVPALLRQRPHWLGHHTATLAAVSVLLGGFFLRYSVLAAAPVALRKANVAASAGPDFAIPPWERP